jgi:antitoxin PrlF
MSQCVEDETTVNDSYSVTVPAAVRKRAEIEPGDKLQWTVDEEGQLSVAVVNERYGAFSELDPVDIGTDTDVVDDHNTTIIDNERTDAGSD